MTHPNGRVAPGLYPRRASRLVFGWVARSTPGFTGGLDHLPDIFGPGWFLEKQGSFGRHLQHVLTDIHDCILVASSFVLVIDSGWTNNRIACFFAGLANVVNRRKSSALQVVINRH